MGRSQLKCATRPAGCALFNLLKKPYRFPNVESFLQAIAPKWPPPRKSHREPGGGERKQCGGGTPFPPLRFMKGEFAHDLLHRPSVRFRLYFFDFCTVGEFRGVYPLTRSLAVQMPLQRVRSRVRLATSQTSM